MKPLMLAGVVLTAMGIIGLIVPGGIHYMDRQKLPHDGETQVISRQEKVFSISPVVSGLALAGGLLLMAVAARK